MKSPAGIHNETIPAIIASQTPILTNHHATISHLINPLVECPAGDLRSFRDSHSKLSECDETHTHLGIIHEELGSDDSIKIAAKI